MSRFTPQRESVQPQKVYGRMASQYAPSDTESESFITTFPLSLVNTNASDSPAVANRTYIRRLRRVVDDTSVYAVTTGIAGNIGNVNGVAIYKIHLDGNAGMFRMILETSAFAAGTTLADYVTLPQPVVLKRQNCYALAVVASIPGTTIGVAPASLYYASPVNPTYDRLSNDVTSDTGFPSEVDVTFGGNYIASSDTMIFPSLVIQSARRTLFLPFYNVAGD